MEMLPLFDDPTLTTPELSAAEKNPVVAELDADLHHELLRWQPSPRTVQDEIAFLGPYVEKFGFARDQRRLKTLHHYLEKV